MDGVISEILAKNKKQDFDSLKNYLEKNLSVLKNNAAQLNTAIGMLLEQGEHSLGICYLLYTKANHQPDQHFVGHVESFLDSYNASQIRDRCADKFAVVVHKYTELLRSTKPARGINRLGKVINTFCEHSSELSPVHPDFALLCLLAKNYKAGQVVLERTIYDINPTKMGVTPKDFMLYYYYGSMIWMGLKDWDKAYNFLLTCVTVPCNTLSSIMVEAYKKFIIAALITQGKFTGPPKHCSTFLQRNIKKFTNEYNEFATAFAANNQEGVVACLLKYKDTFENDKNMGIVQQAIKKARVQAVQKLTSTYLTLSLSDIAGNVGLTNAKEAEEILLGMIESGDLNATINQKDGMVSFNDQNTTSVMDMIEEEIDNARLIVEQLEKMDDDIQVSRDYVQKQLLRDPTTRDEIEDARSKGKTGAQKMMSRAVELFQ